MTERARLATDADPSYPIEDTQLGGVVLPGDGLERLVRRVGLAITNHAILTSRLWTEKPVDRSNFLPRRQFSVTVLETCGVG